MSLPDRIRVMVVDDHPIMRNGLRDTLEASGRFEVVGQAEDGEEAVRTVEEIDPQVIVMDVIMPNKDGIDACRDIMELLPETRVLMLTASTEEDAVIEAVAAGATGYLQKYSRPEELVEAVLDVARGRLRIPGKVVREVFALVCGDRELAARQATAKLTARERETLTLFAGGRSYTEIAEARGNSAVTVRNTLYRIQEKLGIGRKQELVIWAVRNGLVDDVVVGNGLPAGTEGAVTRDGLIRRVWGQVPLEELQLLRSEAEKVGQPPGLSCPTRVKRASTNPDEYDLGMALGELAVEPAQRAHGAVRPLSLKSCR